MVAGVTENRVQESVIARAFNRRGGTCLQRFFCEFDCLLFGGRRHIRIAVLAVPRQFRSCQSFYCAFVGCAGSWHLTAERLPAPGTPIFPRPYACGLIAVFLREYFINILLGLVRVLLFCCKEVYLQPTQPIFIPCFRIATALPKMRFCEAIKQSLSIAGLLDIELKGFERIANGLPNIRVSERTF